ncbi:MAG: hypothetical protein HYU29_03045 [Chloroflexi bacterium]|nr:hypothetical protein [Chloroflexota bacterium]
MLDLHCHILPGLDDGPKTLEESLAMARLAAQEGTQVLVATPHNRDVWEHASIEKALSLIQTLNAALVQSGVNIHILPGMENHLEPDLPLKAQEEQALSFNGGRYILVELPFFQYPPYVDQVLFQLQVKGFIPVIAHPERCEPIQRKPRLLVELVERGMLSQITAGSLLGSFGSPVARFSQLLLSQGLVHLMASDAHSSKGHRVPLLKEAVAKAARIIGQERALALVNDTPAAIVGNKSIRTERPGPPKPPGRGWPFLRLRRDRGVGPAEGQ